MLLHVLHYFLLVDGFDVQGAVVSGVKDFLELDYDLLILDVLFNL